MSKEERAQFHRRLAARISQVQVLDPHTNQVDETESAAYREHLLRQVTKAHEATELGCEAFERLLHLTETRDSGQIRRVAEFLAVCWGDRKLDPEDLRSLDEQIGDDMLAVLNAIRHANVAVYTMAEDAPRRVPRALRAWGLRPPADAE